MPRTYQPAVGRYENNGTMPERSYREVAAELLRRHGWKLSTVRVQQLCLLAEAKLRRRLAELAPDGID